MQELRLVAVSEDGSYAVLAVPGRSGRFVLPIDERLRTVARGQFSRLAQYEIEVESPLRPKEIQDRIRAGETAEDIADAAGLPVDQIRRFEGPVLAEREFRAQEAQRATVRGYGDSGPGPRLGEVVAQRLTAAGASTEDVEWDSRKRQDGNWQVQLAYTVAGRLYLAEWVFDPRSKHVSADDDQAVRLSLPEADWPADRPGASRPVTATVTPIGSWTSSGSVHQADQRAEGDQTGGRGILHPSRQVPAAASGSLGGGSRQSAGQGRQSTPAADSAAARNVPVPAAGAAAGAHIELETAAGPAGAGPAGRESASSPYSDSETRHVAEPQSDPEQVAPAPAKRASSGRARRSSVPSWDEIMFGNSRQTD